MGSESVQQSLAGALAQCDVIPDEGGVNCTGYGEGLDTLALDPSQVGPSWVVVPVFIIVLKIRSILQN